MYYITDGKSFIQFMKEHKKGKEFWDNNKKYLDTHKISLNELNKLYENDTCSKCPNKNGFCNCILGQPHIS